MAKKVVTEYAGGQVVVVQEVESYKLGSKLMERPVAQATTINLTQGTVVITRGYFGLWPGGGFPVEITVTPQNEPTPAILDILSGGRHSGQITVLDGDLVVGAMDGSETEFVLAMQLDPKLNIDPDLQGARYSSSVADEVAQHILQILG